MVSECRYNSEHESISILHPSALLRKYAKPQIQFTNTETPNWKSSRQTHLTSQTAKMAEEPQPSNIQEGADPPDALPANAEDRKAAKAMASLDTKTDEITAQPKKEVDLKALDDAMKNLGVGGQEQKAAVVEGKKREEVSKPLVKVDQGDVGLLVSFFLRGGGWSGRGRGRGGLWLTLMLAQADQLDMSKAKATELLRANDADAVKAMTAWVTASV